MRDARALITGRGPEKGLVTRMLRNIAVVAVAPIESLVISVWRAVYADAVRVPMGPCAKQHASPRLHLVAAESYLQKRWRLSTCDHSPGTSVAARSTAVSWTVAAATRVRARLPSLWTFLSIARSNDTAAGGDAAAGLVLGRVERNVAV